MGGAESESGDEEGHVVPGTAKTAWQFICGAPSGTFICAFMLIFGVISMVVGTYTAIAKAAAADNALGGN